MSFSTALGCSLTVGLGIETNFTIRFDFDSQACNSIRFRLRFDSISIILDISYNKWQFFSRESNLLNAVNYGSLVVAY